MVTWQMSSRDPKRSRSWPRYLWSKLYLNNGVRYMVGSYWLPIGNHTLGIQWWHDRWRHVTRNVKVVTPIYLNHNISITVRDRRSVLIDHLYETLYCESNGHVTDVVTWPQKVKVVTQISLKLNISTTVQNGWIATKLAHDRPQYSPHPRSTQGQGQGKRSRDTGTSVISRNVCYTVPSDVLSLHALSLWSIITLSFFYYKCQAARCNVYIIQWATPSFSMCQIAVNMVYKL